MESMAAAMQEEALAAAATWAVELTAALAP